MKNIFLLFFVFLFVSFHTQYSYSVTTNTELSETCLKTNELSKISLSCFNSDAPLKSVGFYFGCSRMLQYSIVKKKDGRIKVSHKKLAFDIDKIYFKHERKLYIDRKTLEMKNRRHEVIGQCKPVDTGDNIEKELEEILKNNTFFNQI